MRATGRLVAVLCITALVAVACTNKKKDDETTPRPTDDTRVRSVASFQVVGTVTKAFADVPVPYDVPETDDASISGPTADPDGTPVGDSPSVPGVLRLDVEDTNDELTDACGVTEGSDVRVFWTTATKFDPSDVLADIEDDIEDEVAGIAGRVFKPSSGTDDEIFTPEPDETTEPTEEPDVTDASPFAIGSPDAGDDPELDADCVLVADQIGFESDRPSPTDAPLVRRTAAPTAEPEETDEPTAKPKETKEPDETDEPATPTAVQDG